MAGALEFERAVVLEEASRPEEAVELLSAIGETNGLVKLSEPLWDAAW